MYENICASQTKSLLWAHVLHGLFLVNFLSYLMTKISTVRSIFIVAMPTPRKRAKSRISYQYFNSNTYLLVNKLKFKNIFPCLADKAFYYVIETLDFASLTPEYSFPVFVRTISYHDSACLNVSMF